MSDLNERLARILTLIPYVRQNPGVRVNELAEYLGCKPETIASDLESVLMCGVPPYLPSDYISVVVEGDRVSVSFAEHFRRPVNFTFQEALSLVLALERLPLTRQRFKAAQELKGKIMDVLPSGARDVVESARRQVDVGALEQGVRERVAVLRQAIEEAREVHMTYYTASRDEITERDLRPYGLVEHDGEWYVIGHCLLRDSERPFRVDRIQSLRLLDRAFAPPRKFDIERYRSSRMYFPTRRDLRVRLKVAPEMVRWVREELSAGRTRELEDGSHIVHVSVSQPEWIVSWVLEKGGKVELLAPEALRKKVKQACDATLAHYG